MMDVNIIDKAMARVREIPGYIAFETKAKKVYLDVIMRVLGPVFEVVTRIVPECKGELDYWEDGRRFSLGMLPDGPGMTVEKQGDMIRYVGPGIQDPNITLLFKNLDAGMMALTTYMGTVQAAAEDRVLIRGDNGMALEAVRILDLVETYLFPQIILNRNFRRAPKLNAVQRVRKARVYAGVVPAVVKSLIK